MLTKEWNMNARWFLLIGIISVFFIMLTATIASANTTRVPTQLTDYLLRRCENNYDDEELAAMQSDGEDGYEPDDCPLLAHVLTGPMLLNFCQPGDEDWVKFKAKPDTVYQIRAEPPSNYPTEPHLELYADDILTTQNDHYFNNNAEIWWWNTGSERWVYVHATELGGRHDCGNNAYTLTLHAFEGGSFAPSTPTLIPTPTIVSTDTLTPTITPTPGS
jgi:hypothetical protein